MQTSLFYTIAVSILSCLYMRKSVILRYELTSWIYCLSGFMKNDVENAFSQEIRILLVLTIMRHPLTFTTTSACVSCVQT